MTILNKIILYKKLLLYFFHNTTNFFLGSFVHDDARDEPSACKNGNKTHTMHPVHQIYGGRRVAVIHVGGINVYVRL